MPSMEIVKLLLPLLFVDLVLKVFCLYRLYKDEVKYLPKFAWAPIIILINIFGSLVFLFIGRKKY